MQTFILIWRRGKNEPMVSIGYFVFLIHTNSIFLAAIIAFSMIQLILYILEGKSTAHLRKEEGLATENTNLVKDDLPNSKLRCKMANVAVMLKAKLNRKKSNGGCNDIIENGDNICMDAPAGNTGYYKMIAC